MQTELDNSQGEITIKDKDPDEKLTNALKDIADQIIPPPQKDIRRGAHIRNEITLKSITKLALEEAEWKWELDLKKEAIELERKLRERAMNYPNDPITDKVKDEIIWTVVNAEKQQETVSAILEKITDLINTGRMPAQDDIAQMIQASENQKYLDIESILKQANFILEAKKSLGTMHEATTKALIKYILSNKNVWDLKEFFDKHTPQKQIDEILKKEGAQVKSKNEIEKDALIEIGELFLKTRSINPKEIKQIAEELELDISDFVKKVEMLKIKLSPTNIDPKNLERFVNSAIYTAEEEKRKTREARRAYLTQIADNYKENTTRDLAKIAKENRSPLGLMQEEHRKLASLIKDRGQQPNKEIIAQIIEEMVNNPEL